MGMLRETEGGKARASVLWLGGIFQFGDFFAVNFKNLEIFLVNFTLHSCVLI